MRDDCVEIYLQGMLDPFSKVLSYAIQNSTIKYSYLTDLCYLCHRGFLRDRDKHLFGRTIVFELIQAIKFKTTIPDSNFLLLLHFVLQVKKRLVRKSKLDLIYDWMYGMCRTLEARYLTPLPWRTSKRTYRQFTILTPPNLWRINSRTCSTSWQIFTLWVKWR